MAQKPHTDFLELILSLPIALKVLIFLAAIFQLSLFAYWGILATKEIENEKADKKKYE